MNSLYSLLFSEGNQSDNNNNNKKGAKKQQLISNSIMGLLRWFTLLIRMNWQAVVCILFRTVGLSKMFLTKRIYIYYCRAVLNIFEKKYIYILNFETGTKQWISRTGPEFYVPVLLKQSLLLFINVIFFFIKFIQCHLIQTFPWKEKVLITHS